MDTVEEYSLSRLGSYSEYQKLQHLYHSAVRFVQMKLEILNGEFKVNYARNPIHHIESRLKTPKSMIRKLERHHWPVNFASARENINDIGGIRVVCCYLDDVYQVSDMLLRQDDMKLIKLQDYIKEPNFNGYRSVHLDLEVPVYLSNRTEHVMVEVQIRTVAMDFWASLEHDLRYKQRKDIPDSINQEMIECGDEIAAIDLKMQAIHKKIDAL